MAIKHGFTILCETLLISQHGKLSLIDAFLNVKLTKIPGPLPRFCVAVGFTGDIGDEYVIELVGPSGDPKRIMTIQEGAVEPPAEGTSKSDVTYSLVFAEYKPLIFTSAGLHHIVLRDKTRKKVVYRQPFNVSLLEKGAANADDREAGEESKTSDKPRPKASKKGRGRQER